MDLPDQDEYEVRVYDTELERRLVAAVEIVSPGHKDRPESRRAFVAKCATLLRQDVSVSIVDIVTIRPFNFYAELLTFLGPGDLCPSRRRSMPLPAAGSPSNALHGCKPGPIRSPSLSRCRRCRCGWPITWRCP